MKRWTRTLLALLSVLALGACGSDTNTAPSSDSPGDGSAIADDDTTIEETGEAAGDAAPDADHDGADDDDATSDDEEPSGDHDHSDEPEVDDGADASPTPADDEQIADGVTEDVAGEDPAEVVITASYRAGTIEIDSERVDVPFESEVLLTLTSDVPEEVHVHGYDLLAQVGPEAPGILRFVADIPGSFEVELESNGTFVVELVVRAD